MLNLRALAICLVVLSLGALPGMTPSAIAQDSPSAAAPAAQTAGDPAVPLEELKLMLRPLTKDELVVEADAWLALLKAKVAEISKYELGVKHKNKRIEQAQQETPEESTPEVEERAELLEGVNTLNTERTALIDRVNTVLAALELKGGDISEYELYVKAVAGITMDVSDVQATSAAILGWLKSPEGGIRWAKNIILFFVVLVVFWVLSRLISKAIGKALERSRNTSDLLRDFARTFVRRAIMLIGLLFAATMLEFKVGPLVAVVGAGGFILAFALQGTLSNFAAGLMILAYRPYDVGDVVNVAGVLGTVESMSLVSTQIKTPDNQRVIVPNNSIWGGVVTNVTGLPTRRVDLVFGIGYADDIGKAQHILEDILRAHPLVLDEPAPVIKLHELADSSVNFVCRPWAKTSDYWTVYWDVTQQVKERFDAEGVSIPFPQRDVHVYQEASPTA